MSNNALLVTLNTRDAERALGGLADQLRQYPGKLQQAIARALNRSLDHSRANVVKEIREKYNVPAKDVRHTISLSKASKSKLSASLHMKGNMSVPLIHFGARATKRGVSVRVLKSSSKTIVMREGIKAFIAKGQVMVRLGKARAPIKKLFGPGFVNYLNRPEIKARVQQQAGDLFRTRVIHEAENILRQLEAKK